MRLRDIVLVSLGAFALAETIRPLRKRVEPRLPRTARNLAFTALTLALPKSKPRRGLVRCPRVVAVLILDYTLWWWHRANHEVPVLWRFHRVHHADRDLDVTTALRFHVGEMTLAAILRHLQTLLFGSEAVESWQKLLLPAIFFQHANLRLPRRVDDRMALVVVTPRMHGIHHSIVEEETNSNYASLFTWWDMLHDTLRLDVPQDAITIGAPDQPDDVSIVNLLTMPFQ
jgi:sterol desaturase/sphingolipid hydroxylase (fatty acid hydroxylase superfamily)